MKHSYTLRVVGENLIWGQRTWIWERDKELYDFFVKNAKWTYGSQLLDDGSKVTEFEMPINTDLSKNEKFLKLLKKYHYTLEIV